MAGFTGRTSGLIKYNDRSLKDLTTTPAAAGGDTGAVVLIKSLTASSDGTLDFYTKGTDLKSGMESVQSLIDELGISQEEAMRIKQLEPEDQILELTKLRTLKKRKDSPYNDPDFDMAEGCIIVLR